MRRLVLLLFILIMLLSCAAKGDIVVRRALSQYDKGNIKDSIPSFEEAITMERRFYSTEFVYTVIGNAYKDLKEYDKSVEYHEKALEIDPQCNKTWVNLGVAFMASGDLDSAERCYKRSMEIEPNFVKLHVSLGALYSYRGEADKALSSLERAIELAPRYATSYSNYAIVLATLGRFEEAESSLNKAISLGYKHGDILRERINTIKEIGELK